MQDADIYLKTEAGRDEIKSRSRGLSMAIRAILLMVDGQRNVAALRAVIAGSKAPGDTLETLLGQGLIEPRTSAPATVTAPVTAPAPAPAPAPAMSISTPRSATMARSAELAAATDVRSATDPDEPAAPALPEPVYDGPLDLTLPTLDGSPAALAATGDTAAPASSASRYEHLYTMMNEIVRDFLPAHRRYFIQLKIERCGTASELVDLLDTVETALAKARGDAFAHEVVSRLRNAVG